MKSCLRCGADIPSWVVIDGVRKNTGNRKYCLECSPWGMHNTKQIHLSKADPVDNTCQLCKRRFVADSRRVLCNACSITINRMRKKMLAISYLGGRCAECGFAGDPSSFAFHHRESETKEFEISKKMDRTSWEKLVVELDKCELLCTRCHGRRHSRYADQIRMAFVQGDGSYWQRFPWFDPSVFDYLTQ